MFLPNFLQGICDCFKKDVLYVRFAFIRTKYLSVLITIITKVKVEVCTNQMFKPSSDCLTNRSKAVLLLWIPLLFMFHVCFCYVIVSVPCSLVITCCELAVLLALLCVVFSCAFVPFPICCSRSGVVLDCIDS